MAADLWNTWNAPTIRSRINKLLDVKEIKVLNDMPDKIKLEQFHFKMENLSQILYEQF